MMYANLFLLLLLGFVVFSPAAIHAADNGVMGVVRTNAGRRSLEQTPAATPSDYCVVAESAKAKESALQAALDWACGGSGGVDCSAIREGGACFFPDTLHAHASYAFDYYYVLHSAAAASCDFDGLATTTPHNPSNGSCIYPSLLSGSLSSDLSSDSSSRGPSSPSSHGVLTVAVVPHACTILLLVLLLVALL